MKRGRQLTGHAELTAASGDNLAQLRVFSLGDSLSELQAFYRANQILHVRGAPAALVSPMQVLRTLWRRSGRDARASISRNFSIENDTVGSSAVLDAASLFSSGERPTDETYYASCIVQGDSVLVAEALQLTPFKNGIPPCIFDDTRHSFPVWLFIGRNSRKLPMEGRPEHTDAVSHSGTYHYQATGTKLWFVRPQACAEWGGCEPRCYYDMVPVSHKGGGATSGTLHFPLHQRRPYSPPRGSSNSRPRRSRSNRTSEEALPGNGTLRIECLPGDLLFINTRLWLHHTQIPCTTGHPFGVSVSCARDFFCDAVAAAGAASSSVAAGSQSTHADEEEDFTNMPTVFATRRVRAGSVVLRESELPECALPRSDSANCEVGLVEDSKTGETEHCLIARTDISKGELLSVLPSDSEDEDSD
jgi:hypothetical protein